MTKYTNQEIIESIKKRENEVVRFITEKYLPQITYMIESMNGNYRDGEDVFQDALIILITKIDKNEFKLEAKFSTYLYAVCKNLWLYELRKRKEDKERTENQFDDIYYPEHAITTHKNLQQKLFWHYYEYLNEVCKKILRLYWLDVSVKEIAKDIGNTENYIRKRKYECKKNLVNLIMKNKDKI